ncbi:MAG: TetR/AcrR family transcriptional regulator [Clostridia bacterium]|nr:TetR/AcrR family transcriptional regulator [Clostridia bacterium]
MTRKILKETFLELLQKKPLNKISVTEICESADLNRSTFYAHYMTVDELLQDIQDEILANIPKVYDSNDFSTNKVVKATDLENFFSYVKDNAFHFKILLLNSENNAFCESLKKEIMDYYISLDNGYLNDEKKFRFVYSVNGAIGMMIEWIKQDFPYNVKKFTQMVVENGNFMFKSGISNK